MTMASGNRYYCGKSAFYIREAHNALCVFLADSDMGDRMSTYSRLSDVYNKAARITFDASAKIVMISDCHRGNGSWVDNFLYNQHLYYAALKFYYNNGFVYFDLGDSEELWKFHNLEDISKIYIDIYRLLHDFYSGRRLYMLFGNHDIEKSDPEYARRHMARFYDNHRDAYEPLFEGITVHEGIILQSNETGRELFLVHGHQGDIKDDRFWKAGRFFVYHFWRRMEYLGFKDITSAAKNNIKKKKVEHDLTQWAVDHNKIIIAGNRRSYAPAHMPFRLKNSLLQRRERCPPQLHHVHGASRQRADARQMERQNKGRRHHVCQAAADCRTAKDIAH